ncbi:MAG: terminase small subunit [Sulfuricaulis sp.]|nr:terminase small subunit [Sulfuricaulis sp.]
MPLNPRQQRFVDEYLKDLNATQAAIRAGYSEATANQQGPRLLVHVGVQSAIAAGQRALSEQAGVTVERIIRELAAIAFANLRDVVTWDGDALYLKPSAELDTASASAIKKVKQTRTITRGKNDFEQEREQREVELHDKQRALELLGRHFGMFREQVDITLIESLAQQMGLSKDEILREAESILRKGTHT